MGDYEATYLELSKTAWKEFQAGNQTEAFALWLSLHGKHRIRGVYLVEAEAYLKVGEYRKASATYAEVRKLAPPSLPVTEVGVALWLAGEHYLACADWLAEIHRNQRKEFTHMDAAGGVNAPMLLWWASHFNELAAFRAEAVAELIRLRSQQALVRRGWPGPIADHILGRISSVQLRIAATSHNAQLESTRRCRSEFYESIKYFLNGDSDNYIRCLMSVIENSLNLKEDEARLARYEIDRVALADGTLDLSNPRS